MPHHKTPASAMTIAFDIDDTITRHPAFFALLSQALVQAGHRVLIITFRDQAGRADTEADLAGWGIAYHELICWSMACCDPADVDAWKGTVCREHGVDVFFEDDPLPTRHCPRQTVRLHRGDLQPQASLLDADLNESRGQRSQAPGRLTKLIPAPYTWGCTSRRSQAEC